MLKRLASVGDRFHYGFRNQVSIGKPLIAVCGTIYVPHTLYSDETQDDFPYCLECHKIMIDAKNIELADINAESKALRNEILDMECDLVEFQTTQSEVY